MFELKENLKQDIPEELASNITAQILLQRSSKVSESIIGSYFKRQDINRIFEYFNLSIDNHHDREIFRGIVKLHEQTLGNCAYTSRNILNAAYQAEQKVMIIADRNLINFSAGNHLAVATLYDDIWYISSPNNCFNWDLTLPMDQNGNVFNRLTLIAQGGTFEEAINSYKCYEGGNWRLYNH